jgi:divalent metal cation (Fe/Co/Zn/Cd) transporter
MTRTAALPPVADRYQIARRVTLAGIAVSALLAASNILAGFYAHSTAVAASGFEFAGDVLASSIVLIGMGVAARPADANHPYGHGRFETLAAFIVGVILSFGGATISYQSLQNMGARHEAPRLAAVLALLAAIVLRAAMATLKFRVGRRLRSASLTADAWNDSTTQCVADGRRVERLGRHSVRAGRARGRRPGDVRSGSFPRRRSLRRIHRRDCCRGYGPSRGPGCVP